MKKLVIISSFIIGTEFLMAQPSKGNPGVNPAPFGFVELLALAGAAYGSKKAFANCKKHKSQKEA